MPGRIAFVLGEDRHFRARALPLIRAARELGMGADVVTGGSELRPAIEQAGARAFPVAANLRRANPITAGYAAGQVAAALKAAGPDLVHCIGLGASLVGGAACAMAGLDRRAYSLGPLGMLAVPDDRLAWLGRRVITTLIKGPLRTERTRFIFETEADPPIFRFDASGSADAVVMAGTGVDPEVVRPLPMPLPPPLRVALAGPLTWANGVDVAVEAVRLARAEGIDVALSVFGDQDVARIGRFGRRVLAEWEQRPGIMLQGPSESVTDLWHGHHVACLPARAGAGVPAFLLQAAACGRPLVVTDVPGCRDLLTDSLEGFLVPPDDPAALARAFAKLAADPVLLPRMGAAARARVLHGYLERDLTEGAKQLYLSMLDRAA